MPAYTSGICSTVNVDEHDAEMSKRSVAAIPATPSEQWKTARKYTATAVNQTTTARRPPSRGAAAVNATPAPARSRPLQVLVDHPAEGVLVVAAQGLDDPVVLGDGGVHAVGPAAHHREN